MKKIFIAALILMMMVITGCGGSGGSGSDYKFDKKLVIGLDEEYAPMGFRDKDGNLIGFDIDLAKEAAKRLGTEFEFRPIDWDNKREEITSGNVDMLWNGTDITEERKEYMIYTKPYLENRQILMTKVNSGFDLYSESDLAGLRVGTQAGSSSRNYIESKPELMESFKEFKTYLNFKEAYEALDKNEVDVIISDETIARYTIYQIPNKFELAEVTIGPVCEIGIGFRKDEVALRDTIQKVFDEMIADGTTKKISEKWFHADIIKYRR
ncbi:MAG: amino acid ABC transporter substrate-binding protein [Selenomonadaceae bacterium]|nr:amino acid ABC transporter substrate-binding protein [Selenomonadaceae bacterium]